LEGGRRAGAQDKRGLGRVREVGQDATRSGIPKVLGSERNRKLHNKV